MALRKRNYPSTMRWTISDTEAASGADSIISLDIVIDHPPPDNNPLTTNGSITDCCADPLVTVWLTDSDGDNTYTLATITVTPPPDPQTLFSATFPAMPAGDYTLTVQVQCGNETVKTPIPVTLPPPPQKGSKAKRNRR